MLIVLLPSLMKASSSFSTASTSLDSVPLTKADSERVLANLQVCKKLYAEVDRLKEVNQLLEESRSYKDKVISALRTDNAYLTDINNKQQQAINLQAQNLEIADKAVKAAKKKNKRARNWQTVLFILGAAVGAGGAILILK